VRTIFTYNVSDRLMTACVLAIATTVITGWIGGSGMYAAEAGAHEVLSHLGELDGVKQAHVDLLSAVLLEHESFSSPDEAAQGRNAAAALQTIDGITTRLNALDSKSTTIEGAAVVAEIRSTLPGWRAAVDKVTHASAADPEIIAMLTRADSIADSLKIDFDRLTAIKREVAHAVADRASASSARARIQLVVASLLGTVLCFIAGMFIARGIVQPLKQSVAVLEAVADGDFTRHIDLQRSDELGAMAGALNGAIGSMHTALNDVRDAAEAVATASYELSGAGDQISSGAQAQASSLEETSASLADMTATVKQNAQNAEQASALAKNARTVAEHGGQIVSNAVSAMAELNTASKKIVDIITTIDEIAFQTNLLALNAAVEAARAGEQGRGFAVVAGEVRNLAQRSSTSAKEIRSLIQDSVGKVENGTTLVHRSGETLREIVVAVERMSAIVDDIASASRDQATGIDQLNRTVSQMDKVTQANAAQTEELSATAQSMSSQAEQLRHLVSRFRLQRSSEQVEKPATKTSVEREPAPTSRNALARLQDGEEVGVSSFMRNGKDNDSEFHEF
jgi:methyl-accepting chemotaxis protein